MKEVWKPINGFPDYAVSNLGRVCRISKFQKTGLCLKLTTRPPSNRVYIHLYNRKTKINPIVSVPGLVASAFLGPRPKGMEIDHVNAILSDNRASNLEYVTHLENQRRASALGLYSRGETHYRAKLTEAQVKRIRRRYKKGNVSKSQLARDFHVGDQTIRKIVWYLSWKHIE